MYNEKNYDLGANRSCIRELFEYGRSRAEVVGRENVFDFSLGNPCIPAPKEVNEAICAILADTPRLAVHGYTPAIGEFATRQAIAWDLNNRYGTTITPEELFIGCGAAPELTAVFAALAVQNAEILAITPYFPEYRPFVEQSGATFKVVPADIPDFQIPIEKLTEMLNANTVAVIVNSPNNPAGTVYTEKTLRQLADLLTEKSREFGHPIYIVSDEPYRELAYGVDIPFIPTLYPNTIVCYSYSKSLSLPGERIGYIYVPRDATDSAALYAAIAGAARAMGHVCAPSLMQLVLQRCAHLNPDLSVYDRNRRTLLEALREYGYEIVEPEGAFYLFLKAPGGDDRAFSQKAMAKDLLLMPSTDFGWPGYLRLCYCVSYYTVVRSLPVFKALMEEYK